MTKPMEQPARLTDWPQRHQRDLVELAHSLHAQGAHYLARRAEVAAEAAVNEARTRI